MVQSAAAAARSACRERQKAGLVLLILFCTAADAAERLREGSGRLLLDAGADQARFPVTELFFSMGRWRSSTSNTHTRTHTWQHLFMQHIVGSFPLRAVSVFDGKWRRAHAAKRGGWLCHEMYST